LIVFTLASQIRALITIRNGLDAGRPVMQLMNQIRARIDQHEFLQNAARRLRVEQLMQALVHVSKIDRISKGAAKGDAWDELLQLGLRFAVTAR
jgi:DNA polymerase-3 subunit delta